METFQSSLDSEGGIGWEGVVLRPYPPPSNSFSPPYARDGFWSKRLRFGKVSLVCTHGCSHAHKYVCCFVSLKRDWGIEREGLGGPPLLSGYLLLLQQPSFSLLPHLPPNFIIARKWALGFQS